MQQFFINDDGSVFKPNGKPVRVMTNPPEIGEKKHDSLPITADYDLFSIIPLKNQNYNIRPLEIKPKLIRGDFELDFLNQTSASGKKIDVNMGNLHHFAKVIINDLNKEIINAGYRGGKLVWHGEETGNPFASGFDINDKPIFFTPLGEQIQIKSVDQLKEFYGRIKNQGFSPEYNAIFGF
jgi:insecticidal toxin complex protein TccC